MLTSVLGSVFACVSPFEPVDPVMGGVLGVVAVLPSRSSITKSIGILPFKQLIYRWQKLSHNSWTCDVTKKREKMEISRKILNYYKSNIRDQVKTIKTLVSIV